MQDCFVFPFLSLTLSLSPSLCLSPPVPTDITADTALSLDGNGRLDYSMSQSRKRDILLRQALQASGATSGSVSASGSGSGSGSGAEAPRESRLEVKFRTRNKSGTLLHIQESSNYTTVKVSAHVNVQKEFLMGAWPCGSTQEGLVFKETGTEDVGKGR